MSTATNRPSFSQAQMDFLELIRNVFRNEALPFWFWCRDEGCLDLSCMNNKISDYKQAFIVLHTTRDVQLEKGMLTSIYFEWTGKGCNVSQYVHLNEPYFDENIEVGERKDGGFDYGDMVYDDSISLGTVGWIQAAIMLYRTIGIPEKADRIKFVELVKAL